MNTQRVADMTIDELKTLVTQIEDERLHSSSKDDRTLEEVLAAMDQIRWTPAAGSKTALEMIREDRDR